MLSRVLVPLEGSPESETVVDWVASWAPPETTTLLFHCIPSRSGKAEPSEPARFGSVQEAQSYLEGVARARLRPTEVIVRVGHPGDRIVTATLEGEAGVVALGVPSSAAGRASLGKAAEIVARTCPRPVLLLKTPVPGPRGRLRRILAPLSGALAGDVNLDILRDLARSLGAEIVFLHVSPSEPQPGEEDARLLGGGGTLLDTQLTLIRQVRRLLKDGIGARTIMTKGDFVEETLSHEMSLDADIVAVAREGHRDAPAWRPIATRAQRAVLLFEETAPVPQAAGSRTAADRKIPSVV